MILFFKYLQTFVLLFGLVLFAQKKVYHVNKIQDEILVTGTGSDKYWKSANCLSDFSYPWEKAKPPKTSFRALWSDNNFFFLFTVKDSDLVLPQNGKAEMDVINSDRVEIFFKSKADANPYYSLEMDALGRHLDSRGFFYHPVDFEWNWPEKDFVLKATQTKNGYIIEGSVSLESLRQLGIYRNDGILLAGLYRGEYDKKSKEKISTKWISWIIPTEKNFHVPSSFGVLKLKTDE